MTTGYVSYLIYHSASYISSYMHDGHAEHVFSTSVGVISRQTDPYRVSSAARHYVWSQWVWCCFHAYYVVNLLCPFANTPLFTHAPVSVSYKQRHGIYSTHRHLGGPCQKTPNAQAGCIPCIHSSADSTLQTTHQLALSARGGAVYYLRSFVDVALQISTVRLAPI